MDCHLSITVDRVNQILNDPTISGIARIDRIKIYQTDLYNQLKGLPPEQYGEKLMNWSFELFQQEKETNLIEKAQTQLSHYMMTLTEIASDIENMDHVTTCIHELKNNDFLVLSLLISKGKSKVLSRFQSLKLSCKAYEINQKKNNHLNLKLLKEQIMTKIVCHNCYFSHIFKKI